MNILVAVDFSDVTPRVVDTARELATGRAAKLWLVHVAPPEPEFIGYEVGPQVVRQTAAMHVRQEHKDLQALAESLRKAGVEAAALLLQGATSDKLLEEAGRLPAGLLVIGTHGKGALRHLLLGSVSRQIIARAACPVVVVPAPRKA